MTHLTAIDLAELRIFADRGALDRKDATTINALLDAYEDMAELESAKEEIDSLQRANEELETENADLRRDFNALKVLIRALKVCPTCDEKKPRHSSTCGLDALVNA